MNLASSSESWHGLTSDERVKTKRSKTGRCVLIVGLLAFLLPAVPARCADNRLTLEQLITAALEVNPRIRAARERWYSARHQINQNYAPADPTFGYSSIDSPQSPLFKASQHAILAGQSLQFPGKALLQGNQARRTADIARLSYEAAIRDAACLAEGWRVSRMTAAPSL